MLDAIAIASVSSRTSGVVKSLSLPWEKLSARFAKCEIGDKDGNGWMPADIEPGPRTAERVKSVSLLVLDVEADAEAVKDESGKPLLDANGDHIKRYIGPEPPTPDAMIAELGLWNWRGILHTSYSHTEEHPRYRLTFALSRPLTPAEVKPLGLHVAALIGIGDCIDTGCLEPARLFYLPRCPADRQAMFRHAETQGIALPVDDLLTEAARINQAYKSGTRRTGQSGSVIDAFNAAHDVGSILEQCGYLPKGRKRWLWAGSTTGLPGVRLLPDSTPERIYSSHGGDPLNDGHAHDAFDLWKILRHGGDAQAAVKDAAQIMGMASQRGAIAGATAQATPDAQAEPLKPMAMEPEPLRATLPPAEAYPVEALGDILGGAALALHESVKAPLALCCQSVLAAASLAAQAHYDIVLPWGERKPLSLFLLTVGQSGERKSGIDDLVLGAAKAQERKAMDEYALDMERYESDKASWDQAVDAARKSVTNGKKGTANPSEIRQAIEQAGDKPVAPVAPLRFVTDPTVEGLFKLLVVGQPSVALFSDEGGLLIGGHALNSDNALKTMARWCKLWDGSPFDRVRGGDGAGVLYGRRMALHQLAQPEVMIKLLSDPMANGQGFLARCLVAWPSSTIGTRHVEQFEWAGDRREVKRLYAVLSGLMEAEAPTGATAQELDPVKLPLSDEAKALAVAASNQFESLMAAGADLAELQDRTSKAMDNACRIAGVLTVIEQGLAARVIEAEPLQRALILVQWYLAEALRIRGAAAVPQSVSDAEMLSAWLRERSLRAFRSAQPLQAGPNQLRHKPRLSAAINELVTAGYLIENDPGELVDGVRARKSWRVIHHVV